jgi:hypothetical protein
MSEEQNQKSVLNKYNLPTTPRPEITEEEEKRAYSIIKGRGGYLLMLEFRFKNGDGAAFGYSYFAGMSFDASGKLEIYFAGNKVTVTGRNLKPVFDGLLVHSVGFLREMDESSDSLPETETFIESIKIEPLR